MSGANSQDRGYLVTKSAGIELGSVSKDGAGLLETTKPVGDGARRQADALAELAARSSTTWDRSSRCCCSCVSTCWVLHGSGSHLPSSYSPHGANRGGRGAVPPKIRAEPSSRGGACSG